MQYPLIHYCSKVGDCVKAEHRMRYIQMGLKISYYRKLKGFTQEELAEMIGRSLPYIGAIEAPNIARAISLDTLFDIADALGVSPEKFLVFDE